MYLLSTLVISLWWTWATLTIIMGAEESQLRMKQCAYYRLTMYMDCNNLNLGEIRPNTYPVNESRVKDLLLHHNSLRKLEYNVFYNLPNLLSLDLSDNFLSSLDYRLFVKTPTLKTLNLRNNRLTILGDGRLFELQKKLISLVLDFNRFKYVNESVLNPLVSLQTLFLFGNSLVCDCELKKAMLWCESRKIETGAVCESPNEFSNSSWTILNKQDCNKTENVTTKVEILDSLCSYNSVIKSLDCKGVPLRSIRAKSFPNNLSLEILNLQNTSLSVLESDALDSLSDLKFLDLSNNFLENLDPQLFSKLNELITLNLSHNKFLTLPDDAFKTQKKLKILKLNYNHLAHLTEETLTPLVSLEHLDLSNNRFTCDCDLIKAMLWCDERNLSTGATCVFPRQLSGSSWAILQNNTDCIPPAIQTYSTTSPGLSLHHMSFNNILLITIISIATLFLLSIMGALWYICKSRRKDDSMIYDDICLEERNINNYEVLEEKRETNFDDGTINKSTKSNECGSINTASENTYEDLETLQMRKKQYTSNEDSNDCKIENKESGNRDVASYMDMSGAANRPRKENIYVLK